MPSEGEHRRFAVRLARLLGADPHYARLGAMLPDLDVMPFMEHRRSLHDLKALMALMGAEALKPRDPKVRGLMIGYLSHLSLDFLTAPSRLFTKILRGVGCE